MGKNKLFSSLTVLIVTTIVGVVTGFALGVVWTTDQAISLNNLNAMNALSAAEDALHKQGNQLIQYQKMLVEARNRLSEVRNMPTPTPAKMIVNVPLPTSTPQKFASSGGNFTGEDLMQAVNKYRREHGVPELALHSGLCQLASRRLGELLNIGDLDNHAGFENYFNENEISDLSGPEISNVAENLASGYDTAWDTVMGWDSSPPHRRFLLADGAYVYGCGSANLGFAVLIGGF